MSGPSASSQLNTLAPPVVAVIVTCDPGPWFVETLRAFAAQEYPELSVLVLDAGSAEDPTATVATELPGAFVRRLGVNRGFGASANEALTMVEGASHFLFCHDDVAPAPDAIYLLVEESYRSNAGVVAPKLVSWDDPDRLLHVGMAVDKGGAVVDRVEPGEVDHGQHDAVRDVFLAPGGCTLVRADLFAELGGFDADVFVMGEDLDLCWRAQIAGARVLVAPQARVRHLELLASGRRQLPDSVLVDIPVGQDGPRAGVTTAAADAGDDGDASLTVAPLVVTDSGRPPSPPVTLQSLQRRHELHAVLKSYGPFHLVRVLPQLMALAVAEYVIARASGHRDRAAAVAHAWRWNLVRRRAIRSERVEVKAHRVLDDAEVRRLQLHGSARLNAYIRRAVNQGLKAAHLGAESDVGEGEAARDSAHRRRLRADALSLRVVVWAVVVIVLVFGTRQLLGSGFPYVGQLLPLPSAGTLLHRFFSGWQPSGVGTTDPTSPATGVLGVAGLILFGGVGLLQKIIVLGCIPAGALGMARLVRPLGSRRARLASTLVYLAVPVPYDALATGRWDALLAYAASPWIVSFLARASKLAPFGVPAAAASTADVAVVGATIGATVGASVGDTINDIEVTVVLADGAGQPATPDAATSPGPEENTGAPGAGQPAPRWRRTVPGQMLGLGVLEALLTAAAPSGALLVLVIAFGLALGSLLIGGPDGVRAAGRIVVTALGATVAAFVLLVPWSVSLLSGVDRWQALIGLATSSSHAPGWGAILRLSLGPIGNSPLSWAFLASAALPLVIGSRWRLAWAGRAWVLAIVAWVLAWAVGHHWLGPVTPSAQVLLAPAAVAVAVAVGLGAAAFESDLPGYRFGWRQGATVIAAVAAAIGVVPVLAASANGRWDLPLSGYGQATSWMGAHSPGNFRVLWLGDPRVLPGGGWPIEPGLAYSISENGLGNETEVWSGSSPGAAVGVGRSVDMAERGATVRLGGLLAPYAIRYVVVVDNLAPSIPGFQTPPAFTPPADLNSALLSQLDLRQIIGQGGFEVFVDDFALPERGVLTSRQTPTGATVSTTATTTTTTPTTTTSTTSTTTTTAATAKKPATKKNKTGPKTTGPKTTGPKKTEVTQPTAPLSPVGADRSLVGWRPVLSGPAGTTAVSGRVPAGTVVAAVAPAGSWHLVTADGGTAKEKTIFGYAPSFQVTRPGVVTVAFQGSWGHGLEILVEFLLWLVALGLLVGRRRSLVGAASRFRRRRERRARRGAHGAHGARAAHGHGGHGVRRDGNGGGDHGDDGAEATAVVEEDGVSSGAGQR